MIQAISRRSVLLQAAIALSANWPEFRGHGDSITPAKRLPLKWSSTANITWAAETAGYGQSSPVVWGNRVFVTSVEGAEKDTLYVSCLDVRSGRELWRKQFAGTQRVKFSDTTSKAAPTPCVDSRQVYVFFESGDLIALDHNGQTMWWRKLTEEYGPFIGNHGVGSSPRLTSTGLVVLAAHGGPCYLVTVDKLTGKNLWRTERETKTAWTTPLVVRRNGGEQIIVTVNGRIDSYDAANGQPKWSVDGMKGNLLSSASVSDDMLVAGSSEKGNLTALRFSDSGASVAWKAENATAYFGSPLIHRDRVWMVGKVGVGWCLDLKTGRELWRSRLAGECWASPLGAADRVYSFTVKGVTEVYSAAVPTERVAENTLDDMERTYGVAVVNGGFVVRSGRRIVKIG